MNKVTASSNKSASVFRETLSAILHQNEDTEFGKRNGFQGITSYEDFRIKLPLTDYNSYSEYIVSIIEQGAKNVLSNKSVNAIYTSSGTTATKLKLIPRTPPLIDLDVFTQRTRVTEFVTRKRISAGSTKTGAYVNALVMNSQGVAQRSPDGIPIGAASAIMIESAISRTILEGSPWESITSPHCHLLSNQDDANFVTLVFALEKESLEVFSGSFISSLVCLFATLEKRWPDIVRAIRDGNIFEPYLSNTKSTTDNLVHINSALASNPSRADQLELILSAAATSSYSGVARVLWSNLYLVSCLAGGTFASYIPVLRHWLGNDVAVYSPCMVGSEGSYGINLWPGEKISEYAFNFDSIFLEFIPDYKMEDEAPETLEVDQLKLGHAYEIVLTTFDGLCRYRVGDVIRVLDVLKESPTFDIEYRRGSLLNIVNEFTTEFHIYEALRKTMEISNLKASRLVEFTSVVDLSMQPARYIIYIEISVDLLEVNHLTELIISPKFQDVFDKKLQVSNPIYQQKRDTDRIGAPIIHLVIPGAFAALKAGAVKIGTAAVQYKTPHLLTTSTQKNLMENLLIVGSA